MSDAATSQRYAVPQRIIKPYAPRNSRHHVEIDTLESVQRLISYLNDPARERAVLIVTPETRSGVPRVPPRALYDAVGSEVSIAVITVVRMVFEFCDGAHEHYRAYNGAIRLIRPIPEGSDPFHPLFAYGYEWGHDIEDVVRRVRIAVSEDTTPGVVYVSATGTPTRRVAVDIPVSSDHCAEDDQLGAAVLEERARTSAAQGDLATVSAEVIELRGQVRSLTDKLTRTEARLYGRNAFSNPEKQFRHEIRTLWLHTVDETDRIGYPLRKFTVGADFLQSLHTDSTTSVERERLISVCLDVLTQRVWENNGREAHQHRESMQSAKARVRPDGATAWRCAIQRRSPSARRLMWWECTNGAVELAKVAVHDDVTFR